MVICLQYFVFVSIDGRWPAISGLPLVPMTAAMDTAAIIVRPEELVRRFDQIHGKKDTIQSYLRVTREAERRCIESRGLKKKEERAIVYNELPVPEIRDFSKYLNNWESIFESW